MKEHYNIEFEVLLIFQIRNYEFKDTGKAEQCLFCIYLRDSPALIGICNRTDHRQVICLAQNTPANLQPPSNQFPLYEL